MPLPPSQATRKECASLSSLRFPVPPAASAQSGRPSPGLFLIAPARQPQPSFTADVLSNQFVGARLSIGSDR